MFEGTRAIVDNVPQAGFSLELQTKPADSSEPYDTTVVHELAHQRFGGAVTQWKEHLAQRGLRDLRDLAALG